MENVIKTTQDCHANTVIDIYYRKNKKLKKNKKEKSQFGTHFKKVDGTYIIFISQVDGILHREDGPALVIRENVEGEDIILTETYYKEGVKGKEILRKHI